MKTVFYSIVIFLALFYIQCSSETSKITENEILWDSWGVPHIYATSEHNLYYSFGWSQMRSHGDLIMKLYGQARGTAAEYWGVEYLKTDLLVQQVNLPQMAEIGLNNLSENELSIIQSFADGFNAYAKAHPESISKKFSVVLPIKPFDIVAHGYRVFYLEFLIRRSLSQSQKWTLGSNAWAVGPTKSKSNNALLLANPHLPWYDFWLFYEAHLNLDNLNLYGATLVGFPFIGIGFNEYLGWTHTVNTIDNVDVYEITTKNDKYLLDGKYHDIDKQTRYLKLKENSGNYRVDTLIVKTTQHGIILREKGNKAIAIRFSKMKNPPNILKQWYEMGKSTSYEAFENALKLNELPLFNVIYADKGGNILYYFGGHVPKKSIEDWNTWRGIVCGDESSDIWNTYHNYEELPKILNPENGWLQNANDPPYTSTIPTAIDPENYPGYLAPNNMGFRPQQSANLLLQDDEITFDELIEYKHSTNVGLAERILDDFIPLKDQVKDSTTRAAFEVLDSWDKNFNADSKGAVLFISWIQKLAGRNLNMIFETPWSFDKPITTPFGIKDKEKAILALTEASQLLIENFGTLEVEYGEAYRTKVGKFDFPANGGFGHLGLFRTLAFQQKEDGKYYAYHGDSFVAVVEFGYIITAKVLLSYGNSSQSGNKHIGDQLSLFAEKKMRDALIYRKDVELNLELKEYITVN